MQVYSSIQKPRFGCRIGMVVGNGPETTKRETYRRHWLLEDPNSFLRQAQSNRPSPRDGRDQPWNFEDLTGILPKGNLDGWGVGTMQAGNALNVSKSAESAVGHQAFKNALSVLASQDGIAHIRASTGLPVRMENAHPFNKNWLFVHNGAGDGQNNPQTLKLIKNVLKECPEGDTLSEVVFDVCRARMKQKAQALRKSAPTPLSKVEPENVLSVRQMSQALAKAITDITRRSSSVFVGINPAASPFHLQGALQIGPAVTSVMMNERVILASVQRRKLYLGKVDYGRGVEDYIIASELPAYRPAYAEWMELPENMILTLEKDAKTGRWGYPTLNPIPLLAWEYGAKAPQHWPDVFKQAGFPIYPFPKPLCDF